MKNFLNRIYSVFKEIGVVLIIILVISLVFVLLYELSKKSSTSLTILALVSYSIAASLLVYVITYSIPISRKRYKLSYYIWKKTYSMHTLCSSMLMDICRLANDPDANNRDRTISEWVELFSKVSPYQKISGGFIQNDEFDNFYEYYKAYCSILNRYCFDLLAFNDILNSNQIKLITDIEGITSEGSSMNRGIKFAIDISGKDCIPEPYAHSLSSLYNHTKNLTDSTRLS